MKQQALLVGLILGVLVALGTVVYTVVCFRKGQAALEARMARELEANIEKGELGSVTGWYGMSLGKPLIIVLLSLAVAGYCAIHLVKGVRQDRAKPNSTEEGAS